MKITGHTFLLTLVGLGIVAAPTSVTAASTEIDSVRALAERAAELTAEERTLLEMSTPDLDVVDRASIEARIQTVDAQGAEVLAQLDRLDVELTQAIRVTLGPLASVAQRVEQPSVFVPTPAVYEAATTDLLRIAATPDAVTNVPQHSNSPAFGLLAVASLSLLALGAAALGNSLRRRPDDDLAAMAWSDGLTGLANRRRLDVDLERHDNGDRRTAAIMIDIDHFKDINDTFGHAYGDDVLRRVGEALSRQVRSDDVVYRYGGEEFCVLLPGASASDASDIADRIVSAVRAIELPHDRTVTVSVGVADTAAGDASGAVQLADQALYAAKGRGRDRAVASDEHPIAV